MKQIFFTISLFITAALPAQPFISMSAASNGAGLSIGYLDQRSNVEFSGGYRVPFLRADRPWFINLSVAKRLLLDNKEEDNFSLTPSVGYALYSVSDFSHYDESKENSPIISVKKIKPFYGLELGKDWHLGRLYVIGNYCGKPSWGIGIRAFFK